jgi:hypothetical protein
MGATAMRTIDDIRTGNLRALAAEYDGTNGFAALIGRTPQQVSQWLNRTIDSRSRKPRVISSRSCRMIERALGREAGWMDMDHATAAEGVGTGEHVFRLFKALPLDERVKFLSLLAQGVS